MKYVTVRRGQPINVSEPVSLKNHHIVLLRFRQMPQMENRTNLSSLPVQMHVGAAKSYL